MPIYAYRCGSCGHAKDLLQRMADPVLTVCPVCGESTFQKQVTAAGFQLKGSGWYATDFRGGTPTSTPAAGESAAPGAATSPEAKPATADSTSTSPSATHSCTPGCTSH